MYLVVSDHIHPRFHLQGFDGSQRGDVFGEQGLLAVTAHKLGSELVAEDRGNEQTHQDDDVELTDSDRRELPAVN